MFKYFIAEGIINKHSLFVASQDIKPNQIINDLPAIEETQSCSTKKIESFKNDEMKIAWRYQNMKIYDSSNESSVFGHYYDLTKKMSKETLESANIETWNGDNIKCQNVTFDNEAYMDLLLNVDKTITSGQFSVAQAPRTRNILRIGIQSLGSRLWLSNSEKNFQKDLLKFLYMFRALLRESFAVAIITIPALNFDDTAVRFQETFIFILD